MKLVTILIAFFNSLFITQGNALPDRANNSAYIWEEPTELVNEDLDMLFQFAKDKNIEILYLNIEEYLNVEENPRLSKEEKLEKLNKIDIHTKYILQKASKYNLRVHALAGGADWAKDSHRYIPTKIIAFVKEFNSQENVIHKFSGVQFDIEYYNANTSDNQFLDVTDEIIANMPDNLSLGFAIPFHINTNTYKQLLNNLSAQESYLVVMAYRNTHQGRNGTIAITRHLLETAQALETNTGIVVGQETLESNEVNVSFSEQQRRDLENASAKIEKEFLVYDQFVGISIHTLQGYIDLSN